MTLSADEPSPAANYRSAEEGDDATLAPESRLALARAWLAAAGDSVTQVRRVTVLRPVISARVPRHHVPVGK